MGWSRCPRVGTNYIEGMSIDITDYIDDIKIFVDQWVGEHDGACDADINDMQGEAMLALVEARDNFEGRADFRTYLYTVVRHKLSKWRRTEGRYRKRNVASGDMGDVVDEHVGEVDYGDYHQTNDSPCP